MDIFIKASFEGITMKKYFISAILVLLISSSTCFAVLVESDTSLGIFLTLDEVVGDTYSISVDRINMVGGLQELSYDISISEEALVTADFGDNWSTDPVYDSSTPSSGAPAELTDLVKFDSRSDINGNPFLANTMGLVETLELQITDLTTPRWIIINVINIVATDENGNQITDIWTWKGGAEPSRVIEIVPEPATMAMLALGGLFLRRRKQA
jgi:hypothetical protein